VTFIGQAPIEDVYRWYGRAHAFLLPSRAETFGLAALEAAAASLPLVLSPLPAFKELFAPAATLCPPTEMPDAIRRVLADQDGLGARRIAARHLADRFTAHAAAETLLSLIGHERSATRRRVRMAR
jgi:glycosyltransferase involved in cell wall biosynthesis